MVVGERCYSVKNEVFLRPLEGEKGGKCGNFCYEMWGDCNGEF